ncbi:MAG TPA: glycoside hydrolase family 5 protein [Steroidobacteraceae bacterium]|nr:glycoside hydrolase family 5 protein [Steroidobacteraceae bacterium]
MAIITVGTLALYFSTFSFADAHGLTGEQMVKRMGAGINLGNVFDAPNGEGTWRSLPATESEIAAFRAAGFTHLRLPVTWGNHLRTTPPYTIDPKFLSRIKQVAGWAASRGMVVVIDAHHEDWFKKDPVGQAERFDALWMQISHAFKDQRDDQLVFEVLNESDAKFIDDTQTNELNARILRIIRKDNPNKNVIIGAVGDNAGRLRDNKLLVPSDAHIICTFHTYDPWSFASGQVLTWGSTNEKVYLLESEPNFSKLSAWSARSGCPLYVGEFAASVKDEPTSRAAWYGFISEESRKRGFAYAVWEDGGEDQIYDRKTESWSPGILDTLFNR